MKVAIIGGSGKMGQWFAKFLLKDGKKVIVIGRSEGKLLKVKEQLGVDIATNMEAVRDADVILISVPIDSFEGIVEQICPHIHTRQVVIDLTSIKAQPVKIMHKYLKTGLVLGVHPVFGPGARDMTNHNFVLTPTSGEERTLAQRVRQYLETRGARVTLMTPREHDEMMSVVLGLSHFIALVSADTLLGVDKLERLRAVGGTTYKVLLALVESVVSEDPEFYASLQMNLPNVMEIEKLFQSNAKAWTDLVESKDSRKFAERMNTLREGLEKVNPDFGKGYESMYKLVEGL